LEAYPRRNQTTNVITENQRLAYDPEDEIVVKERLDYFDKQNEEREQQEAEAAKSKK